MKVKILSAEWKSGFGEIRFTDDGKFADAPMDAFWKGKMTVEDFSETLSHFISAENPE